jgi:hypothetical protein
MNVITKKFLVDLRQHVYETMEKMDTDDLEEQAWLGGKLEMLDELLEYLNEMSQLPGSKE